VHILYIYCSFFTWSEDIEKDCHPQQICEEDALDHRKWRKLIIATKTECKCVFGHWLTQVNLDKGLLNGLFMPCTSLSVCIFISGRVCVNPLLSDTWYPLGPVFCCCCTVYSQLCLCILAANDLGMWSSYKTLHQAEFLRHIKITKEKVVSVCGDCVCMSEACVCM